jgi:hypothetical protein
MGPSRHVNLSSVWPDDERSASPRYTAHNDAARQRNLRWRVCRFSVVMASYGVLSRTLRWSKTAAQVTCRPVTS